MTLPIMAVASNVPAPPATPPASGLTTLARTPAITDDRWMAGYDYRAELPAGVVRNRSTITDAAGANVGTGEAAEIVRIVPILLEVEDRASTFVGAAEDYPGRATRLMESYTSKLLERELWTGEIAVADSLPNRYLASAGATNVTPGTGASSPQAAVAILMDALGDAGMGDGMIHAPRRLGIQLPDGWRNADTYSEYGFVVVAGAGYSGSGPDGTGTNWMYATEIVNVRLGPVEVLPDVFEHAVDRASNEIMYRAQRVGAVDFAGPVFACQVSES